TNFAFEAALPKGEAKLITGHLAQPGGRPIPVELERTTLESFDPFDARKEELAKATGYEVADTALKLLAQPAAHKGKPEEVRSWADKAYKAADPYGPLVHADTTLRIADALSKQEGYADVALGFARRAERALDPKAAPEHVGRTLDVLASALKAAGKADEVK